MLWTVYVYSTVEPTWYGPLDVTRLSRVSRGSVIGTVTFASAGSLTISRPCGSVPPACATLVMTHSVVAPPSRQVSMSAWVMVYEPWQVVEAPGASVVASQVTSLAWSSRTITLCRGVLPVLVTVYA